MDDSDVAGMFPQKEINGNLSMMSSQPCQPEGSDEVDSSRVFLPPSLDDTDGCSRSMLPSNQRSPCKIGLGGRRNDNEDDGYCSQDQILHRDIASHKRRFCSPSARSIESALNNNINKSPPVSPSLGDATGKVLSVSMPPGYMVRSNEARTTFRPNLNEMPATSGDDSGVCLREIPSRHSLDECRSINENSLQGRLCAGELHPEKSGSRIDGNRDDNENLVGAGSQRRSADRRSSDEAGIGLECISRKRKGRDEEDGDEAMVHASSVGDPKRLCRGEMAMRQPVKAPLSRQQLASPTNRYDIKGQANWVVQAPQDCTFHIYQTQNTNGGHTKQHTTDWAGVSIHQISDAKLKKAFEETSKAISSVFNWKRFARLLPVTQSPTLEKDLQDLESCSGSAGDKALAVLLRWWKGECKSSYSEDIRSRLKEGLVDCGLRRMARNLDKIFQ